MAIKLIQVIQNKWQTQCLRPWIAKIIWEKNNGAGGIILPDFRLYYKANVIKTVWYWHKNRHIDQWNRHTDQWNRTESQEINPRTNGLINLWQRRQICTMEKRQPLQLVVLGNWTVTCKIMKLEHSLLLLSRFSRVWLCATPETAAYQAPLSLGFSRQERWSGLPFPSPMHESEKWKWSCSVRSDS